MRKKKLMMTFKDILYEKQRAYERLPDDEDILESIRGMVLGSGGDAEKFIKVYRREMKIKMDLWREKRNSITAYETSLGKFGNEVDSYGKTLQFKTIKELLKEAENIAESLRGFESGWGWIKS